MKNKFSISAFFPCYNDKGTIGKMVKDVAEVLKTLTDDFEVIVIDDGSTDGARDLLRRLEKELSYLKVVFHEKNQGYGGALQSGFKTASKNLIFYTDGDAQYNVKELPLLYEKMTDDVDIVNGYKIKRSDSFYRKILGRMYHWTVKILFRVPIRDVDCDFRLIRREMFDKINLTQKTGAICTEMITKIHRAGFKFIEVPVHHYHRIYGQSQFFTFRQVSSALISLLKLWWNIIFIPFIRRN